MPRSSNGSRPSTTFPLVPLIALAMAGRRTEVE